MGLFQQAQERVSSYFETSRRYSDQGQLYLGDDRHLTLRGDALGIELSNALLGMCGDSDMTRNTAKALLFDIGHSIGEADARMFITKMGLENPIEKMAVGPIYFAHTGLGRVQILPETVMSFDDELVIHFRHKNAIEAESWRSRGAVLDAPGCVLACGYSSGWCQGSFERDMVAVEVTCVAAGDEHCQFIMAPPSEIERHVAAFGSRHKLYIPKLHGRVEQDQRIRDMAYHDSLTGLPNRACLNDTLEKALAQARALSRPIAIAHIDLDNFKTINDTYGHAAGDHVLTELSSRMSSVLDEDETLARIGGDEFIMVMPRGDDLDRIRAKLAQIRALAHRELDFDGVTLRAGCSVGVAIFPDDGETLTDLMVNADLALYDVKEHGRGSYRFFAPALRRNLDLRKKLERDVSSAIDDSAIRPFFQPQFDLATGRISGAECLLRWKHPDKGPVSPTEFLPVVENAGDMVRLGRKIMTEAIGHAARWLADGLEFGRLGLNASAQELREEDFASWILETARTQGVPATKLSIEILETVMMEDDNLGLTAKMKDLRAAGVQIELDDFGTGYASLRQIKPDEIDRLKIDRSFIKRIDVDQTNAMIVRSIVTLAHSLGMEVIAEGAETEAELHALIEIGCTQVQGFGVALPMPPSAFERFLREPRLFQVANHMKNSA